MKISKIKTFFALMTGGVSGLFKYGINLINEEVLGKIKDRATGLKYLKDAQAAYAFVRAILDNHADDLSEERRKRGEAILAAIEELTKALEDFKVNETELDGIIAKVNAAIDSFKKAK